MSGADGVISDNGPGSPASSANINNGAAQTGTESPARADGIMQTHTAAITGAAIAAVAATAAGFIVFMVKRSRTFKQTLLSRSPSASPVEATSTAVHAPPTIHVSRLERVDIMAARQAGAGALSSYSQRNVTGHAKGTKYVANPLPTYIRKQ